MPQDCFDIVPGRFPEFVMPPCFPGEVRVMPSDRKTPLKLPVQTLKQLEAMAARYPGRRYTWWPLVRPEYSRGREGK